MNKRSFSVGNPPLFCAKDPRKWPTNLKFAVMMGITFTFCFLLILHYVFDTRESSLSSSTGFKLRVSRLFPSWENHLFESPEETISFQKWNRPVSKRVNSDRFFYPIEDSIHAAHRISESENQFVRYWTKVIDQQHDEKRECVVLDIGTNYGFYALLARSMDCNVMGIDAQPHCLHKLSSAAAANGFSSGFQIRWGVVSSNRSAIHIVDKFKCSTVSNVVQNLPADSVMTNNSVTSIGSVDINDVVQRWLGYSSYRRITILKVDVGGSEFNVLRSALPLFRTKRIINAIVEVTPLRANRLTNYADMIAIINSILDSGYILTSIFDPHVSANLTHLFEFLHPHSSFPHRNEPHLYLFAMVRKSLQVARPPIADVLRAAVLSLSPLSTDVATFGGEDLGNEASSSSHMNRKNIRGNNIGFQANIKFVH